MTTPLLTVAGALAAAVSAGAAAGALSLPHCMGMCGPLAAGVCQRRGSGWAYQGGRVVGYGVAGGVSGWAGNAITSPDGFQQTVSLLLMLGLFVAALRSGYRALRSGTSANTDSTAAKHPPHTGASSADPQLIPLARRRPDGAAAARAPRKLPLSAQLLRALVRYPALAGVATVTLPCGALYGMLLIAAATGSWIAGGAAGAAFAMTSGVGLLTSAFAARTLGETRLGNALMTVVLVAGMAIVAFRAFGERNDQGAPPCHDDARPAASEIAEGIR